MTAPRGSPGLRRSAADWVGTHGFPTRKDEDWRYTRLEPLLAVPFEQASPGLSYKRAPTAINGLGAGLGGPRLVFVNGRFAPELSRVEELPPGATGDQPGIGARPRGRALGADLLAHIRAISPRLRRAEHGSQ